MRAWTWAIALRPRYVLAALVGIQWATTAALALSVHHNGWLFYQGGDQTFYYSTGWTLVHGHIPQTSIGYAWSLVSAPVALFAGPSFLVALPALILFQTLVLGPLVLVAVYGIGSRIAGRWLGYVAAAGWVVAPYLALAGFVERFHEVYVDQLLPQSLGLTGLGDFASMVIVALAAWYFVRALDGRGDGDAIVAGLLTGIALGIKPANAPFLAGPALALLVARRWRLGAVYGAAVAPALLTLAVWKLKGLGYLPLIGSAGGSSHAAAAAAVVPTGVAASGIGTYLHFDWAQLGRNMGQIREFFWSMRLVEWLPFAGVVAVSRASLAKAALLGGWLGGFVIVKAASPVASVQDGTFFRLLMPAWPAYLLLGASLPLLVPGVARLGGAATAKPSLRPLRWRNREVLAAAVVLGLLPLAVVVALPRLHSPNLVTDFNYNTVLPVGVDMHVRAVAHGRHVRISWSEPEHGDSTLFYRVYAAPTLWDAGIGYPLSIDELTCDAAAKGASKCQVTPQHALNSTRAREVMDIPVIGGRWTYRVAALANWVDDPSKGDTFLLSDPARVDVAGPHG